MGVRRLGMVAALMAAWLWLPIPDARAETEVDVALVLAVDVSRSMDPDEQELQRQGFIEAFRSPQVHDAIRNGMLGRIIVTYFEWSGVDYQNVIVPWTIIDSPETALKFADGLHDNPIGRLRRTSISGAIDFGAKLLEQTGVEPVRRVIDISGDGPNSSGRGVAAARDEAVAKGITINGLPIMLKRPSGFGDMENLDLYYKGCVIGGEGAFLVPVRERQQFADAIRTKIIREIAALPDRSLIRTIQAEVPANCLDGERGMYRWDRN
ncbi:DUF1194 domain-containing protein [Microvirga terrae]|uniref:DUF1194 domain-containing protein n=1 Tax=Microvirga terrae TaxID=2740529 RepID=A0ABY5RQ28_9HYPH|nr:MULTISPECIES: DUF1194 domain-containing protein [Microvirga]MBQ0824574.1 DUF1194 domain-containing protein [Microvirga sp. HBU67558]UVF19368.1 DUF1194 domain-containing protein [Microvirga terrae]